MKYLLAILLAAALSLSPGYSQEESASDPVSAESTTNATPAPDTKAKPEKEPVEMFEILDYDEELDVFYEPGTKTPYNGPVISTDDDGRLETQGALKNGHEDGWWIEYWEETGIKSSEGLYDEGNEEGYWKYFHDNGSMEQAGVYKNGVPIGKWIAWFATGKPDFEGEYVNGLMDGEWTFYDQKTGEPRIIKFEKGVQLDK